MMLAEVLRFTPGMIGWAAAAGILAVMGVVWFYLPQSRRLRQPWRWLLPGLRLSAMAALALALLQPVAVVARRPGPEPPIVVLLDRSRSMGRDDPSLSRQRLMALADELGLLPPRVRTQAADELRASLEALRNAARRIEAAADAVEYAGISGHGQQSAERAFQEAIAAYQTTAAQIGRRISEALQREQAPEWRIELSEVSSAEPPWSLVQRIHRRLAALERSIQQFQAGFDAHLDRHNGDVQSVINDLAEQTRLGLAQRVLTAEGSGLLARLSPAAPVFGFSFDQTSSPVALHRDGRPVVRLDLSPAEQPSNVPAAVAQAIRLLQALQPQGVIVLTDGGDAPAEDPGMAAIAAAGVPVFVLHFAPESVEGAANGHLVLNTMAEASGGAVVPVEAFARVAELLTARQQARPRTSEYRLWDSPYLFLFVLGCLCAEWALRKRLGLP